MNEPVSAGTTALVVTDPQNDFLSDKGVFWAAVKQSVTENNTIENIETMFQAAKSGRVPVFISPHYYYPWDHRWKFAGTVEKLMHDVGMYDRPDLTFIANAVVATEEAASALRSAKALT